MPKKGVRYPKYCPYTVGTATDGTETETYGIGKAAGKAVVIDVTINAESVDFYANDGISESVTEFNDGTAKTELDDLIDAVSAELLGRTIDLDGVLTAKAGDNPPYVKFGFVAPKILNNTNLFRAIVLPRVKFAPPSENFSTKGKTTVLAGVTINGKIMKNKDGNYWTEKTVDTEVAALAYLNAELHITSTPTAITVTSVPADAATAVAVTSKVTLTFSNPIDHGNAALLNSTTDTVITSTKAFDGTKTVLTITPTASLTAATQYSVVLAGMTDAYGQALEDTVFSFTTA